MIATSRAAMNGMDVRVVRIVAEFLGISDDDEGLSLMRQLPMHQAELFELVPMLEAELGIAFSDPQLFAVQTYADLATLGHRLTVARGRTTDPAPSASPPVVWTCIEPPSDRGGNAVMRCGRFTEYFAETILQDALHAGRGGRVQIVLRQRAPAADLVRVDRAMVRARRLGVSVEVYRRPLEPHLA